MTIDDATSGMLERIRKVIREQNNRITRLEKVEIVPASRALLSYAYANLPTASSARVGWIAFCTNGRKGGETAGNGSGVPVYCAETAKASGIYAWFRMSDDTQVAI